MNRMNATNDQIIDIRSEANDIEISKLKYVATADRLDALNVFHHRKILIDNIERIQGAYTSKEQKRVLEMVVEEVNSYGENFTQLISITDQLLALKVTIESDMDTLSKSVDVFDDRIYEGTHNIVWEIRRSLIELYSQYFAMINEKNDEMDIAWKGLGDTIRSASEIKNMENIPIEYQIKGLRMEILLKRLNENIEKMIEKKNELTTSSDELGMKTTDISIDILRVLEIQSERIAKEREGIVAAFNMTLALIVTMLILLLFYLSRYINISMKTLIDATERISGGDYDKRVKNHNSDEFGTLAHAINKMAQSLLNSTTALKNTNRDLESLVDERTKELNQANNELEKANVALSEEKERLATIATTDALTGLLSRRAILEFVEDQIHQAKRYERPFTVMLADLDLFKKVNDNYGHAAGDEVLKKVADAFIENTRETDRVGRFGGEEFLFVFPETTLDDSRVIIERAQKSVKALKFSFDMYTVTFSGGVSQYNNESSTVLISSADKKLYDAKESGRDKVIYRANMLE